MVKRWGLNCASHVMKQDDKKNKKLIIERKSAGATGLYGTFVGGTPVYGHTTLRFPVITDRAISGLCSNMF